MELDIINFKSIVNEKINLDKNKILYFVGQNESGKSNFLKAINNVTKSQIDETNKNFNSSGEPIIKFSWKLSNVIQQKWMALGYEHDVSVSRGVDSKNNVYYTDYDQELNTWIYDTLSDRYETSTLTEFNAFNYSSIDSLNLIEGKEELPIKSEISDLIKESIKLENSILIHSFQEFDLIEKKYTFSNALESKSFVGLWKLVGQKEEDIITLRDVAKDSEDYLNLKEELEKRLAIKFSNFIDQFWNQKTINFKINIEQDGFTVRAADVFDENEMSKFKSLDFRSDGMKHYLTIVLFINFILKQYPDKRNIVLFDEPDRLLHAGAVIDLRRYFDKISNENFNFIIATHNPYFIDANNFHEISFVHKKSRISGSVIEENFARKADSEEYSGLYPFLTKIGIDTDTFLDLKIKKMIFVEGFHDLILLSSACKQLNQQKEFKFLDKIIFMPLGSSTKMPSIVNFSISSNKELPYFIFDYDNAGKSGVKLFTKNGFIREEIENYTYVNGYAEFKNDKNKIETQNIFDETLYDGNKISDFKDTNKFIEYAFKIKRSEIELNNETIKKLKIIFNKIKKYYNFS